MLFCEYEIALLHYYKYRRVHRDDWSFSEIDALAELVRLDWDDWFFEYTPQSEVEINEWSGMYAEERELGPLCIRLTNGGE